MYSHTRTRTSAGIVHRVRGFCVCDRFQKWPRLTPPFSEDFIRDTCLASMVRLQILSISKPDDEHVTGCPISLSLVTQFTSSEGKQWQAFRQQQHDLPPKHNTHCVLFVTFGSLGCRIINRQPRGEYRRHEFRLLASVSKLSLKAAEKGRGSIPVADFKDHKSNSTETFLALAHASSRERKIISRAPLLKLCRWSCFRWRNDWLWIFNLKRDIYFVVYSSAVLVSSSWSAEGGSW